MKWPPRISLRTQVLAPVAGVLVLTIGVLGFANAWLAAANQQREIETRIQTAAATVARANFPLTPPIAAQIKDLVDADLLVEQADGRIVMATAPHLPHDALTVQQVAVLQKGRIALSATGEFLRASVSVRAPDGAPQRLHVYYPRSKLAQLRWQAIVPAVVVAGLALVLAGIFSTWFAERISRPIRALREKTQQIAGGNFQPIRFVPRDDELGDLAVAVNQLAQQLDRFQEETQQAERNRTLAQLGASLAHQLRNFATGAQLALDLHAERCPADSESLQIALRQLRMIEQYLNKLLRLGAAEKTDWQLLDLRDSVDDVLSLLEPRARHAGVALRCALAAELPRIRGDRDGLHQLILNLITNAIEEAATPSPIPSVQAEHPTHLPIPSAQTERTTPIPIPSVQAEHPTPLPIPSVQAERTTPFPSPPLRGRGQGEGAAENRDNLAIGPAVHVGLDVESDGRVRLVVADTGRGPRPEISERMFEPLVTDKADGAGLGLMIAQRVVEQHHGEITWVRYNGWTEFRVVFPVATDPSGPSHAEPVDRRR